MRTLLLVDANPMMHRIIELTFSREDVRVLAVRDGDEAIALMRVEPPDLVLADHAAHGRNGYEVAAFVKGSPELAHVPVLLMAGAYEPVDAGRASESGCDGVLVKPFEPADVLSRFRALVHEETDASASNTDTSGAHPDPLKLVEPAVVHPATSAAATERAGGPELDVYFDRLDAALLGLQRPGPEPARRAPDRLAADADDLPTVERLLAGVTDERTVEPSGEPPPASSVSTPVERPDDPGDKTDLSALADALGARLGGRLGGGHRVPLHDPPAVAETPDEPFGEALAEEVTRRVMLRLAPSVVDDVVTEAVTRVAERMVREELDRVRDNHE